VANLKEVAVHLLEIKKESTNYLSHYSQLHSTVRRFII